MHCIRLLSSMRHRSARKTHLNIDRTPIEEQRSAIGDGRPTTRICGSVAGSSLRPRPARACANHGAAHRRLGRRAALLVAVRLGRPAGWLGGVGGWVRSMLSGSGGSGALLMRGTCAPLSLCLSLSVVLSFSVSLSLSLSLSVSVFVSLSVSVCLSLLSL